VLLKDIFQSAQTGICSLFNQFAATGLPDDLKVARVLPLHKKGSKTDVSNYRPISNLSPFSKFYERCLLQRLNQEIPLGDGLHQHGFKQSHSTETALLTLQSYMAEALEQKKPACLYSVDLSAAFDLLIPDKFYNLFKDKLSEGLMFCLMDFLQGRKFKVDMGAVNQCSEIITLDRGCVQGSVLGPRLFSLYVGGLESELTKLCSGIKVVSYADDTYVLVTSESWNEIPDKVSRVISAHACFLRDLGMTVNESKTEIILLGTPGQEITSININSNPCLISKKMKALGITINGTLSWDDHAENMIQKGKGLISIFRHVRKYMTEKQFLKSVICNFYSSVYYASSVWLSSCKAIQKTKLLSLHFRLLRTACKDYWSKISRHDLTNRCMRATPLEWAKYTTASIAIKVMRDKNPTRLHDLLQQTYYSERRNVARGLFYDSSKSKVGGQSLQNRLKHVAQLKEPWNEINAKWTNDLIRVKLKGAFFACHAQLTVT
jgi:hypothetical protein